MTRNHAPRHRRQPLVFGRVVSPGQAFLYALTAFVLGVSAVVISQAAQPPAGVPPQAAPVAEELPLFSSPEEFFAWCRTHNTQGLRARLNADGKTVIRGCANIGDVLASISPSPTTPVPTTSAPAPTTPPATTPPATTAPPTPSPTPSATPSPTPTPTPTPGPGLNCMPVPSRCGYPDTTNTGPHGTLQPLSGNITLSTPGMVWENKDLTGCVSVRAKNVVMRNFRITCSGHYAIAVNTGPPSNVWDAGDAGLVIEDFEINMAGRLDGKGIAFDGYVANRGWIHNGSDCAHVQYNVIISNTFCQIGPDLGDRFVWCHTKVPDGHGGLEEPHWDGIQSDEGNFVILDHNTIRNPCQQTSAFLVSTNTLPIGNVTDKNGLYAGGGWTKYCGTGEGGPPFGQNYFLNTRISRGYYWWPPGEDHMDGPVGGYYGPMTSCNAPNITVAGIVWDETGLPIPTQ